MDRPNRHGAACAGALRGSCQDTRRLRIASIGRAVRPLLAVVILIASAWLPAAAETGDVRFFFVQITDTHWGVRDHLSVTRAAVARVNELPVDVEFVVHTGDVLADKIGDERTVKEGLEAMKALKAPVYYVPGNHDITPNDSERTAGLFRQYFGAVNGRIEVKGVLCLFVCTETIGVDTRSPGHAQREWVEDQLKGWKGRPTLLFMHKPPIQDLVSGASREDWMKDGYHPRWGRLFEEHPGILAIFAGHLHRDEMRRIGNVPIFVASALAGFWDRQPSFRLYEYRNGNFQYWTYYLPPSPARENGRGGKY